MKRMILGLIVLAGLMAGTSTWADKTHKLTAEVVSADATAKTITVKTENGGEVTAAVEGAAVNSLKDVKPGEKVELTCRDNDKGEHQAITHIAKAKPPAKP